MNLDAFRSVLIEWFRDGHRELPWRQTQDPYRIWVSEVMLQQTRAAAATPYYLRFLEKFPDARTLAFAPEPEVLAAWSGLGYYHRARNLRRAAQQMEQSGSFPAAYEAIRALPGVGAYTAAAVASIAFGLPHAVLDGNVLRVIARVSADRSDIALGATRKRFQQVADEWLDREHPGDFNQALMELGAAVCLPRKPQCLLCPVATFCAARLQQIETEVPVKAAKPPSLLDEMELLAVEAEGKLLLRQRSAGAARMAGFWELPETCDFPANLPRADAGQFRHTIVNTRWTVRVFRSPVVNDTPANMEWLAGDAWGALPLTTITRKALRLIGLAC